MTSLASILASTENANGDPRPVSVIPITHERGLYETHAGRTLENLLSTHGEGHVRFVLATLCQSENNANALVAPIIEAVSDLVIAHPEWAERASEWMDVFDGIRLAEVYQEARRLRAGCRGLPKSKAVYVLVAARLSAALDPQPEQGELLNA